MLSSSTAARMAEFRFGDVVITGPATTSPMSESGQVDVARAARYVTLTPGAAGTVSATPEH